MGSTCRDCGEDLDHCHGTLVHHARFTRVECTDDCATPDSPHAFAIDCEAIGCDCAVTVTAARARSIRA